MPLPEKVRQNCIKVLNKLEKRKISEMFREPVDPDEDNCPDYFQIITKPSDLISVRKKLEQNQYNSVNEFKKEVDLIWSNALKYNGDDSLLGWLALDLRAYFEKISLFLSDYPEIDWINELMEIVNVLSLAVKPISTSSHSSKKRSASIKQFDQTPPANDIDEVSFTHDQLQELADDIKSFNDNEDKMAILESLKEMQPRLVGNKQQLTVNLCSLSSATLQAIKAKVDELKNEYRENSGSNGEEEEEKN